MSRILGLDLGTNSLGWALIDDTHHEIIDTGVRIFPEGVNIDTSGSEKSKNAKRRDVRLTRRQNHRFKLRRQTLTRYLNEYGLMPSDEQMNLPAKTLYELRAMAIGYNGKPAQKLERWQIGRIFLHLNSRRGFLSNRKTLKKGDEDEGKVQESIHELQKTISEAGLKTAGQYFYSLFEKPDPLNDDAPAERIRKRFVARQMIETEFDLIWKAQQQFYPELLTGGPEFGAGNRQSGYYKIKHYSIFYQRPLKSQKHLLAHCRFEPLKRVTPKANPLFQEFRLRQGLQNLRFNSESHFNQPLSLDQINLVIETLGTDKAIKPEKIIKVLHLPKNTTFNDIPELKGLTTMGQIKKATGPYFSKLTDNQINILWKELYFFDNQKKLAVHLENKYGFDPQTAQQLSSVHLEPDYSNISEKALKQILPFMKGGSDYAEACLNAGYHHSAELHETEPSSDGLIAPLNNNELRNPIVQQGLAEVIRVVNAIVKTYGRPDKINIEMARDLKKPKRERENIRRKNTAKEKQRQELADFLSMKLGKTIHPSASEVRKFELWLEMGCEQDDLNGFYKLYRELKPGMGEKYRLWLEANRISVYTGKTIPFSRLFSPEIEIEHIYPYSKSMDNSFVNKILSERSFNEQKGDQTAMAYFNNRPEDEKNAFIRRAKQLPGLEKRKRLLTEEIPDDFKTSQITNTQYMAKEITRKLKECTRDIRFTNGQATSTLRRLWGLNTILNTINEKSRDDHRHHAIDALVIACTTWNHYDLITWHSKFDDLGKLRNDQVPDPWPGFRTEATDRINPLFISLRNQKRLISTRLNKYRFKQAPHPQKTVVIRQQLHEETVYGATDQPDVFVVKKPVSSITKSKNLEEVADEGIRRLLTSHLESTGGDFKAAFNNENHKPSFQNGRPIKTVRMKVKSNFATDKFKYSTEENLQNRQFVQPGNNYLLAIYEHPDTGKRAFKTLTFFEASQRRLNRQELVPSEIDGYLLIHMIQQGMTFIPYDNHPDEINFDNTELNKNVYVVKELIQDGKINSVLLNYSKISLRTDHPPLCLRKNFNTFKGKFICIDLLGKLEING